MARFFDAPLHRDESSAVRVAGLHSDGRRLELEVTQSPMQTEGGTFGVLVVRDRTDSNVRHRAEIQAKHREAVLDLGRLALSEMPFEELLMRAATIAVETLGVDRALISEQRDGRLIRRAVAGAVDVDRRLDPGVARTDERPRARHRRDDPPRRPGPAPGPGGPERGRHPPRGRHPDPRAGRALRHPRRVSPGERGVDRRRGRLPRVARPPAVVRGRGRVGAARSRRDAGASAGHPRQLPGRHRDQGPRGPLPRHEPALPRAARHRPGHDDRAHRTRRLPRRGRRRAALPTTARCCAAGTRCRSRRRWSTPTAATSTAR